MEVAVGHSDQGHGSGATAMPAHDWTRVYPGTFHHFHSTWITHLADNLNLRILPDEFYALAEQHTGDIVPDVITLTTRRDEQLEHPVAGALALAEAPPQVSVHMSAADDKSYRTSRRTLAIRHRTGRRVVALIEILSPGNKDRQLHLDSFVEKVFAALQNGIHVLVVDVHPPSDLDPQGIHGAIWDLIGGEEFQLPENKRFTAASYLADRITQAFVEPFGIGQPLPKMPVFLSIDWYISVELEHAYAEAYAAMPSIVKDAVEGRTPPEWDQG
jgi:hypothetical protein